ncbi:hypothetical protein OXX80_006266 [Metschnikowia pulcherrima]
MSTSPCCAEYKFPAASPNEQKEAFGFVHSSALPDYSAVKTQKDADDYFAIKPPAVQSKPTFISPKKPVPRENASGSVSSLGSEATFTESQSFINHEFNLSTDTLFEDCEENGETSMSGTSGSAHTSKAQRNVLHLSLNMPKRGSHHKARSSLGSTTGLLARQAIVRDAETCDTAPSLSAVEPRFQLDRKYSLGVAEEALNRERDGHLLTPVPTLRKQLTLPILSPTEGSVLDTIKTQQIKRLSFVPPQESFRDQILKLSPTIKYLPPDEIVSVIKQSQVQAETGLRDILVLDIRPLADHVKSHISGSINICLPSTLLKRASFDFKRCVNSLPAYEKVILQNYFYHNNINFENKKVTKNTHAGAHGFPAVIVYDHSNVSSNLYHMCRKLIDHSCYDASSAPPIYLIDAPFSALAQDTDILGSGKVESVDVAKLSIKDPLDETKISLSGNSGSTFSRAEPPRSIKLMKPMLAGLSTPNVSNFSLPVDLPDTKFKIRHNEEVFDFSSAPSTDDKLSSLSVSSPGLKLLPQWLQNSVANNSQIRADFNKLEECEKSRLNSALKIKMEQEFMTPGGHRESTPVINSGLDYGHKNRYKDIFLYEHSRVSLNDFPKAALRAGNDAVAQSGCDYINASYLKSSERVFENIVGAKSNEQTLRFSNAIATQGPLLKTAGDFWKLVAHQGSLVIISLTNDVENGVEKCFAFWKTGCYTSGENKVDVKLVDTEQFGTLKLRTFSISIDNKPAHKVMQLHLDSWMDMGVVVDSDEVLAMIHLKNHILAKAQHLPEFPTVIHCSAGCGRTGVFAAADMLMNAFRYRGDNFDVSDDPVYDIVNDLRRQRISMVQTIRQYGSIYSLLIQSIIGSNNWRSITETEIAKAFSAN